MSGTAQRVERQVLSARWVFPVDGLPLEHGVVEIERGRIVSVRQGRDSSANDLGNVAIIPGLVNCHTHLELSDLAAPLEPKKPFTAWLQSVIAHRQTRAAGPSVASAEPATQTVASGCRECLASGSTLVADIVSGEWSESAISPGSLKVVAFLESIGLTPARFSAQIEAARKHLSEGASEDAAAADASVVRGLSPHAPYSVHPDLLKSLVDLAVESRAPVAMHLAETSVERELVERGTGPFVDFLCGLGVWNPAIFGTGRRLIDSVRELSRAHRALLIHGNDLVPEEISLIADHPNLAVVFCPRTHAFFRRPAHPWRTLLSHGINVALGTDSRASNPDLSLWSELKFLRRQAPDFSPAGLLEMATRNGARALGLAADCGTITPGKFADLATVALPPRDATDPYDLLFDGAARVVGTMASGVAGAHGRQTTKNSKDTK